jgi:hypothetical protein
VSACQRCASALELDDLRCPVCAAATVARAHATADTVTVLRCDGCGAAVSYDASRRAPHCGFCGATMRMEQSADPLEQAQLALPFRVTEAQARAALDGFLRSGGFFRPADLATASGVSSMQALLWAAWVFDAEADVAFATDSDAGGRHARWAPHAGLTRMTFSRIAVSASRGLSDAESRTLVPHYDLGSAADVEAPRAIAPEAALERFELQRSAARSLVTQAITRIAQNNVTRGGLAPGSSFRKTAVSLVLRGLSTQRVLFPVWVLTYRFRDRPYRVVVHGQDASVVLGERPLSVARIALVIAAVVGLAAAIALVVATLNGLS